MLDHFYSDSKLLHRGRCGPLGAHLDDCANLLQDNANLRHVQDLLGHGSLAATERYLRLAITDLKEAHARFHPREKA
jgi:integrase